MDEINIHAHRDQETLGALFALHLLYHACVSDLTRITLAGYNFPLASACAHAPADWMLRMQERCLAHAGRVSDLLESGCESGGGALDDSSIPMLAFESTKIQVVYAATLARGRAETTDIVAQNVQQNLKTLNMLHRGQSRLSIHVSKGTKPFSAHLLTLATDEAPVSSP